jgi:ribosomal protein S15P/S13E
MVKESINESVFKKMRYDLLRYVGERRRLLKYLEISDYRRYKKALDLIRKESDY